MFNALQQCDRSRDRSRDDFFRNKNFQKVKFNVNRLKVYGSWMRSFDMIKRYLHTC